MTAVIAFSAVCISVVELKRYKEADKSTTLSNFNQRDNNDKSITRVVRFLTNCPEEENKIPSKYDREMFARFFEELQYAIEKDKLEAAIVKDLFSYYAIKANERKGFLFEEDDKDHWKIFLQFIKTMS